MIRRVVATSGVLFVLVMVLSLFIGVWLPDAVQPKRVLAQKSTRSGDKFRVEQRWAQNDIRSVSGGEAYSLVLIRKLPTGRILNQTLSNYDSKRWSCRLVVDEVHRTVSVDEYGPIKWNEIWGF